MATETEFRFLLRARPALAGARKTTLNQGYLALLPDRSIRVRKGGDQAWLTIKGARIGATAPEFEYPIPLADADALLKLCGPDCLTKDRYDLAGPDGKKWEVDIFTGRHAGLMIAEIELPDETAPFDRPAWLDAIDITADRRLSNGSLCRMTNDEINAVLAEYGLRPLSGP